MARKDREIEAVENMLIEAWHCQMRLPDREHGFLMSGHRGWWPAIVRDRVTDYPGDEEPRRPLCRREMALIRMVFDMNDGLVMVLTVETRRVLALVLCLRARDAGLREFWPRVLGLWRALPGNARMGTADGMRSRYERALDTLCAEVRRRAMVREVA